MPISKSRLGRLRFRQLQLFEHLFETGSIRNAAIRIGVTQPAASEMLREIEDTFGLRLFDRARRGVTPLPSARVLLERVRISLRELESAGVELEMSANGALPRLRVGAVQHAVVQLFPQAIAEMLTHANAVRITLWEASINDLLEQLELGGFATEAASTATHSAKPHHRCSVGAGGHPARLATDVFWFRDCGTDARTRGHTDRRL